MIKKQDFCEGESEADIAVKRSELPTAGYASPTSSIGDFSITSSGAVL